MIEFENSVTIRRPREEVFAFLANFENVPRWNHAIAETRKTTGGPVGVGSRFLQVRQVPRRSEEAFEVTGYEPPHYLAIRGTLGPFDSELSYEIGTSGADTRLVNRIRLRPQGVLGILGQAAAGRIREAVAKNLGVLKEILEERSG